MVKDKSIEIGRVFGNAFKAQAGTHSPNVKRDADHKALANIVELHSDIGSPWLSR